MPSNPFMGDGGQNLSQLLMALGSGFSMASAANQPWWAGIGPAAGLYGQAQQQAEDRAYRQQQIEQNNQYRQLQEEQMRAVIDERKSAMEARRNYAVPGMGPAGAAPAPSAVPGMAVPPKPPVMGGGQNVNIPQAATAIGKIEGDYNSVGPVANGQGNRAYGKYQVMDFNIGPWTKEVLGTAMTPEQFLADSGAQDAVFNSKFGAYANKYGPEGAARAWFAGEGGMNNPNAKDVLGTTVAGYGRKFADLYGMQNPEAPPESYRGPGTNPMPVPEPTIPPVAGGPPPSPIVPVGGNLADVVGPMPMPQTAPVPSLPPDEAARIQQAVRSGQMTPAQGDAEARSYIQTLRSSQQSALDKKYQADLEAWKLRYGEAKDRRNATDKLDSFKVMTPDEVRRATGQEPQAGTVYQMNTKTGQIKVEGAPLVNMPAGESEALKVQIGTANKAHTEMQDSAKIARSGLAQVNRLSDLMEQLNTGKFTSTTAEIKAAAKSFGIDLGALGIRDDVGVAQAADALSKQLALAMRNPESGAGMPGAMSDADRKFLSQMIPTLETTPEGRRMIVDFARRMYQRQIELAKIANKYIRSPEFAKDPSGMYAKMDEYAEANPLFSDKDVPASGMSPAPAGAIPPPPPGYSAPGGAASAVPPPPPGFRPVPR